MAPGIDVVDTMLGGMPHITAAFLVHGPQPALIEVGAQSSGAAVRDALAAAGVGANDLRWIAVSHIHLDHAGAIGELAQWFPKASVVVHENGARHLVDPTRLINSAAQVYGPLLDSLYGRMTAVPEDRVIAAADGFVMDVGNGRRLRTVASPGHAKHHHAIWDEQTGTLLAGDAVGVQLPEVGVLRPAAPPPEFDLEQTIASLQRFRALRPTNVVLTHFGVIGEADEVLAAGEDVLRRWVDLADRLVVENPDISADQLERKLADEYAQRPDGVSVEAMRRLDILNGVHSNAVGILRYINKRREAQRAAAGSEARP